MNQPSVPPTVASRRDFLRGVGGVMAAGAVAAIAPAPRLPSGRFPIALADRAIGYRQQLGVFAFARDAGVAGVEVDLGRLGRSGDMANRLLDASGRNEFMHAAQAAGVAISSLSLGAFESHSFAGHPKADDYADDLVYLMREMRVRVGVLPVDIANASDRGRVVDRLRRLAPAAERSGGVVAVASTIPPADLRGILDSVDSPAIRTCVTAGPGTDAAAAIDTLGPTRVAQIRFRHDENEIQSEAIRVLAQRLKIADWSGWLVIDRASAVGEPIEQVARSVERLQCVA